MEKVTNVISMEQWVERATQHLIEIGYSAVSLYNYRSTWRSLLKYADGCNVKHFTQDLGLKFLKEVYGIQYLVQPSKLQKHKIRRIKVLHDFISSHRVSLFLSTSF